MESPKVVKFTESLPGNRDITDMLAKAFYDRFRRVCSISVGIELETAKIHFSLPAYLEQDNQPNYPITNPESPIRVPLNKETPISEIIDLLEKPMDDLNEHER